MAERSEFEREAQGPGRDRTSSIVDDDNRFAAGLKSGKTGGAGRGVREQWRRPSMVNPRSARSQSEPQYVIFSERLPDRRQS